MPDRLAIAGPRQRGPDGDVRHGEAVPLLYRRGDGPRRHALGRQRPHFGQRRLLRRVRLEPGSAAGAHLAEAERRGPTNVTTVSALGSTALGRAFLAM
jgi:hypothetical protein